MSAPECELKNSSEEQPFAPSPPLTEDVGPDPMEDVNSEEESVDQKENRLETQELRKPVDELDTEGEDGDFISPCATVVPSNTPVTGDSGHVSPTMESSIDSLSDGTLQAQDLQEICDVSETVVDVAAEVATTFTPEAYVQTDTSGKGDADSSQISAKTKVLRNEKKEEKKKNKRKDDKSSGGEHILRALNSLQNPEEKLAALCKKFADLHEEHRVLQTSFKSQQRTLTTVVREKDQLQSEHTKAMLAKSKLESLCRELQKHNKIIENESIKRAKESDEKRKEISAHFNTTISEIQNQMTDNSEKNNLLRKENENLAEQLRTFIGQCQARDEHVKKLQEQHELENKLAAAKLAQAEAITREFEERSNREKELLLLKLTEMTKKAHLTDSQLELYKSKYEEFNDLHSRSSETFQKYKTEMDKMSKRVKKLEKDGLQWKTKWEVSSKALLEQYELKAKSDQEATVCVQKVKKLESLCRALQAELHRKKVTDTENKEENALSGCPVKDDSASGSVVPSNSPESSSSDQCSPALIDTSSATRLSSSPKLESSLVPNVTAETGVTESTDQECSEKNIPSVPIDVDVNVCHDTEDKSNRDLTTTSVLTSAEILPAGDVNEGEASPSAMTCTENITSLPISS